MVDVKIYKRIYFHSCIMCLNFPWTNIFPSFLVPRCAFFKLCDRAYRFVTAIEWKSDEREIRREKLDVAQRKTIPEAYCTYLKLVHIAIVLDNHDDDNVAKSIVSNKHAVKSETTWIQLNVKSSSYAYPLVASNRRINSLCKCVRSSEREET